jgi:ferredoxin--NADP+ reductase
VQELTLQRNTLRGGAFAQEAFGTDRCDKLQCGLVFRSVGYQGVPMTSVPFDSKKCVFPNEAGRISAAPGLYATGWIKRGPSGIIGTNRACAVDTVGTLLSDLRHLDQGRRSGIKGLRSLLCERGVRTVSYENWLRIDAEEIARGTPKGKPREKLTRVADMLSLLDE